MTRSFLTNFSILSKMDVDPIKNPMFCIGLLRRHYNMKINTLNPISHEEEAERSAKVDDHMIAEAGHFLRVSDLVYKQNPEEAGIMRRDVVLNHLFDNSAGIDPKLPRHAVFIDHLTRSVVVAVRGTATLRDVINDASASPSPILDGKGVIGHKGMSVCAKELVPILMPVVIQSLQKHPSYRILLTGHSLGAGTAMLIALWMRHMADEWKGQLPEDAMERMTVYAFAPPPILSPVESLTPDDTRNMYSFVHNLDCVPRATLRGLELLCSKIMHIDKIVQEEGDNLKILRIASGIESEEASALVMGKVAKAVEAADDQAHEREGPSGNKWLHEQLYIPGRIFHLYPALDDNSEDAEKLQKGQATKLARVYKMQELTAEQMAATPMMEGDSFINDHLTGPYITAFQRLDHD